MNSNLVGFIITIFFIAFPISILFLKRIRKDSFNILFSILLILFFQTIVFVAGMILNDTYLIAKPARLYLLLLILALCYQASLIYMFKLICVDMIKIITNKSWNKLSASKKIIYLIIVTMLLIIAPQILFGLLYMITYGIYDIHQLLNGEIDYSDFFYLSFATYYSLTLKSETTLSNIQGIFSDHNWLRFVPIFHVIVSKLTEFILIGYFITKASEVIMSRTKNKDKK